MINISNMNMEFFLANVKGYKIVEETSKMDSMNTEIHGNQKQDYEPKNKQEVKIEPFSKVFKRTYNEMMKKGK